MIPGLDDYLQRLDRELRQYGLADPRILEEAREHLVDAIEDGRHRGLSDADAEREALGRFGAPEIIAAHMLSDRNAFMTQFAAALNTLWHRKWWILVPTVFAAVVTSVMSYYFLPPRYRSEATILVIPPRVSENYVRSNITVKLEDRLRSINQQVRSRTKLERIVEDLNLYPERRKTDLMQDIVDDMSQSIDVDIVQGDVFRVAFISDNPRTAEQVTERLTTFFIDESLKNRAQLAEQAGNFLETQIADLRRRIIEYEKELKTLKAANSHEPLSQADILEYEVLQERYKELLIMGEDSRSAVTLERRQIGEQFNILYPARLPERPVGPDRLRVNVAGTSAGFALGLVFVGRRRRSETLRQGSES